MKRNWQGQKVLILGAARQGLALARYLSTQGAQITLNDKRQSQQLAGVQAKMSAYPVEWVLGEHPLSLLDDTDLLCVSGGVPLALPIIREAVHREIPLSNDSQIFMEAVPCPVIGITGSAGKTTTTTLLGHMAQKATAANQKVWVGGNIGLPLIDHLDEIGQNDIVILEFSSFQLELMNISPAVAAVLNITPNHLDRHGTLEAYTAAKARILDFQQGSHVAILTNEDPGAWALAESVKGSLVTFGLAQSPAGLPGTYLAGDTLYLYDGQAARALMARNDIQLRGEHNLRNVLAAFAIAYAAGWDVTRLSEAVRNFTGVPHRLEYIRTLRGARWYNDSIATAPERTIAAIQSFDEPLVLLLGGRDKDLPWESLADLIHQRVDHVILFGEAGDKIKTAIGEVKNDQRPYSLEQYDRLEDAIQAAANVSQEGDVVLLSPGGTSYDAFNDFAERGERFRKWVQQLT